MDADILPQLFTKFATKSYTDTGLGLFISKNIAESHNGKIGLKIMLMIIVVVTYKLLLSN
ncbi:MAG: hypothetical protein DLM72_14425 [Candidatus Nitrosopolaris wilkensis]|nr:MAG: hypothetical protein DLM72_14425 [Candidatus Nitrosopolaris wilkensis]